jgi:serine protease AprX
VVNINDAIITLDGTSFSSPIMAGGLVCLWQALPNKTNAEIMQLVRESASKYTTPDYLYGFGIPDLQLALNTALSLDDTDSKLNELKVFPNPTNNFMFFNFPSNETEFLVEIYDILGKRLLDFDLSHKSKKINISLLPKGVYILKVQSNNIVKAFKIIKN